MHDIRAFRLYLPLPYHEAVDVFVMQATEEDIAQGHEAINGYLFHSMCLPNGAALDLDGDIQFILRIVHLLVDDIPEDGDFLKPLLEALPLVK